MLAPLNLYCTEHDMSIMVIKSIVAKKHAGIFAEMAEADKALYNK